MRNVWRLLGALSTVTLVFGCGGASTPTDTPTPTGTAVSMVPLKGLYTGTAANGSQMSFTLSGSDNSGHSYTGSFTMKSKGSTTLDSWNVTNSEITVTMGSPSIVVSPAVIATETFNQYFLTDGQLYKTTNSTGITGAGIAFRNGSSPLTDVVHVGDSGTLSAVQFSDGTSDIATWKLTAGLNGNSTLTISTTTKDAANTVISSEDDDFYLDNAGNPYKYSMTIIENGTTLTLNGNKV